MGRLHTESFTVGSAGLMPLPLTSSLRHVAAFLFGHRSLDRGQSNVLKVKYCSVEESEGRSGLAPYCPCCCEGVGGMTIRAPMVLTTVSYPTDHPAKAAIAGSWLRDHIPTVLPSLSGTGNDT